MTDDTKIRKVVSVRVAVALYRRMEKAAKREQLSVADWQRDVLLDAVRRSEQERKAS